ncbi:hypothetical protein AEAC466_17330 [Asticcacaulis sp. AC466]|uniref:phage head-tail joining protein n=1 Tax=Asticcacaulis sp. AC466 TaxID=1282362 RepID=UPI0003C3D03E|nr:hypothetical protein [Asticcacaulis sp. AC466]ESQ82385.1 hypothetical protein AEAC466_17330 [Asticcacaulis sp. AC466]
MPAPDYVTELAQLQAGLASGEATIQGNNGNRVEYRSVKEIRDAITYFQNLAAVAAKTSVPSITVAQFVND